MTITITIGYWLIPLFVTIISFIVAKISASKTNHINNAYQLYNFGKYVIALIVSLVSWVFYLALNILLI
jgi:hypothetical protein